MGMKKQKVFAVMLAAAMAMSSNIGAFDVQAASQTSEFGLETAYNIAAEGTVLLKNENQILPLEKGSKVNVFGLTQIQTFLGGSGSGSGSITDPVYLAETRGI